MVIKDGNLKARLHPSRQGVAVSYEGKIEDKYLEMIRKRFGEKAFPTNKFFFSDSDLQFSNLCKTKAHKAILDLQLSDRFLAIGALKATQPKKTESLAAKVIQARAERLSGHVV